MESRADSTGSEFGTRSRGHPGPGKAGAKSLTRPPLERRFIFAAVADRIVPPEQARKLWEHWERPRIEWYQGAHITFRAHSSVRWLIEEGLRASELTL